MVVQAFTFKSIKQLKTQHHAFALKLVGQKKVTLDLWSLWPNLWPNEVRAVKQEIKINVEILYSE